MRWIPITDERTPELLEKNGITWQLPAPREIDADGLMINPTRLRRLVRTGGGMGSLTVANATLESPMYVGGAMNLDGTLSVTSAQRKSRTSRGTLDHNDEDRSSGFRRVNSTLYRPAGQVDIDLGEIREKLRNADHETNPFRWANAIDRSVKSGIVENSIRANVLETTFFTDVLHVPTFGKPLFMILAGMKTLFAYQGIQQLVHGVDSVSHLVDWAGETAFSNLQTGLIGAAVLKIFGSKFSIRDLKPSLVDPQIPIDRVVLAAAQQYMSFPVIKYQQPS